MSSAAAPVRPDGELTHRQITTILIGLMTGMFLAALDQNVVGTAIKTIADDLQGLDHQAWVTTAYLITSTLMTPIYGRLSDIYGRKPFFMTAIAIFLVGSLLCTFSWSMYSLAAFRAIQGVGAGGLFSLALAIVGDIVSPRERARYQGYFLAVFGTSSVFGPIIGGFFAQASELFGITGWRWVFLINVPVGLISFATVWFTLHLHHVRQEARIDWGGTFALVVGLVPLLLVAEQGREWGWTSTNAILAYLIGVVGLIAFVFVESRMGDDALIPLRIFRDRTIVIGLTGGFILGAGMFGGLLVLPQYLQIVQNSTPITSGFQLLPMVLGIMLTSVISGQLMSRLGEVRIFPIIGVLLMVVALVGLGGTPASLFGTDLPHLVGIGADTPLWQVMVWMFVFGLGLGNTMQPLTLAVQAAVSPREIGMATSAATFFRQIGGTLGVAIFISVLFNNLGSAIADAFRAATKDPDFIAALRDPQILANPDNAAFVKALTSQDASVLTSVSSDSSLIGRLAPALSHPFKVGFSESMHTVFQLGALTTLVGVIVLLFLPNITLSNQSAAAARAAEARAADEAEGDAEPVRHTVTDDLVDAAAAEAGGHTLHELRDGDRQGG